MNKPAWAAVVLLGVAARAGAASPAAGWSYSATLNGTVGSYSGSTTRNSLADTAVRLTGEQPDEGGFTVGVDRTRVDFGAGESNVDQTDYLLAGRDYLHPLTLPGTIALSLDLHDLRNRDNSNPNSVDGTVAAPRIAFIGLDRSYYLDLGYARSSYANHLRVTQWTQTLGFALNRLTDWVQLRAYHVHSSEPSLTADMSNADSLEMKWTHWTATRPLGVESFSLGGLFGKRFYGVDGDTETVYNLTDIQRGAVSAGATWQLGEASNLALFVGDNVYRDHATDDDYQMRFAYLNLTHHW